MRQLLKTLLVASIPLATAGHASPPDVDTTTHNGTTIIRVGNSSAKVTTSVDLPNGCHQPGSISLGAPDGVAAIVNTVAVTARVTVAGDMCTQEFRVHNFEITVPVTKQTVAIIIYDAVDGQDIKATAYPLPVR